MKLRIITMAALIIALLCLTSASAYAQVTLRTGNQAPGLKAARWFKGTPITAFEKGKVYVVEFWATWCGPCKRSIPHLTELAHKYRGKVSFIGMDASEHEKTTAEKIRVVDNFVKEMGNSMDYNVALDADDRFMNKNWMDAAGQDGIPCAFIVDQNTRIAWIGHPLEMDTHLEQVVGHRAPALQIPESTPSSGQIVEGEAYAAKLRMEREKIEKDNAEQKLFNELAKPVTEAFKAKDYAKVVAECETLAAKEPSLQNKLDYFYLRSLVFVNPDKAFTLAKTEKPKNSQRLIAIAQAFTQKGLDKKFYDFTIGMLLGKTENDRDYYSSLSCLASAYELAGSNTKAIEIIEKMVVIARYKDANINYIQALKDKITTLKAAN